MINYVSSVSDTTKKDRLNNVIRSLGCLVEDTTNDTTEQDYGTICYCGPISVGQVIQGSRKPRRGGTPVISDGTYIGDIGTNGNLVVKNNCQVSSAWSRESQYTNINYSIDQCTGDSSSYYNCSLRSGYPRIVGTCSGVVDGWSVCTVCTCWIYDISERTTWNNAYHCFSCDDGDLAVSYTSSYGFSGSSMVSNIYYKCDWGEDLVYWCGQSAEATVFCDGRTCVCGTMPPNTWNRTDRGGDKSKGLYKEDSISTNDYVTESRPKGRVALNMTAQYSCLVCVTNCSRVIDCVSFDLRYI